MVEHRLRQQPNPAPQWETRRGVSFDLPGERSDRGSSLSARGTPINPTICPARKLARSKLMSTLNNEVVNVTGGSSGFRRARCEGPRHRAPPDNSGRRLAPEGASRSNARHSRRHGQVDRSSRRSGVELGDRPGDRHRRRPGHQLMACLRRSAGLRRVQGGSADYTCANSNALAKSA